MICIIFIVTTFMTIHQLHLLSDNMSTHRPQSSNIVHRTSSLSKVVTRRYILTSLFLKIEISIITKDSSSMIRFILRNSCLTSFLVTLLSLYFFFTIFNYTYFGNVID